MKNISVLLLGAVCSVCMLAQAPTGELAGVIRDATGAVISGASVSVVNEDTGVKRQGSSDDRVLCRTSLRRRGPSPARMKSMVGSSRDDVVRRRRSLR